MPQIINTFSSKNPLAEAIGSLGNSMFGDSLTPALKRQQLADAQREAFGVEEMAKLFGGTTGGNVNIPRAIESGILGGLKPDDIAAFNVLMTGMQTPLGSELTDRAYVGAGKANVSPWNLGLDRQQEININNADNAQSGINNRYSADSSYRSSTENNAADNTRLWDQFLQEPKPANINGQPAFAPQGQLTQPGTTPILNENQIDPLALFQRQLIASEAMFPGDPAKARQHAIAQLSKTTSKGMTVFGPDGNPIVEMGGTGAGDGSGFNTTNAMETQLQKSQVNYDKFKSTIGMARDVAAKNPNVFGVVGIGRQAVQDSAQIAKSLGSVFGIQDIEGTLAGMQQDAAANGVDPGVFNLQYDPALGQIESLGKILAYSGASTIAGQTGNDVSNKDVANIALIIGDPRDWAMNQQRFLDKLNQVEAYVDEQMKVNSKYLFGQPGAGAAPAAPAATAPAAEQKVINGKTYTQQNGQWFEVVP